MTNSRPYNYQQSLERPTWHSYVKGMGDLTDLQPNDPTLQNVYDGTVYGSPGGNYNLPTPADYAAGAGVYMGQSNSSMNIVQILQTPLFLGIPTWFWIGGAIGILLVTKSR